MLLFTSKQFFLVKEREKDQNRKTKKREKYRGGELKQEQKPLLKHSVRGSDYCKYNMSGDWRVGIDPFRYSYTQELVLWIIIYTDKQRQE